MFAGIDDAKTIRSISLPRFSIKMKNVLQFIKKSTLE